MERFHFDPIDPLLPACPAKLKGVGHVAYPSLLLILVLMAGVALIYSLVTLFKFNSIKVFKRYVFCTLDPSSGLLTLHSNPFGSDKPRRPP